MNHPYPWETPVAKNSFHVFYTVNIGEDESDGVCILHPHPHILSKGGIVHMGQLKYIVFISGSCDEYDACPQGQHWFSREEVRQWLTLFDRPTSGDLMWLRFCQGREKQWHFNGVWQQLLCLHYWVNVWWRIKAKYNNPLPDKAYGLFMMKITHS